MYSLKSHGQIAFYGTIDKAHQSILPIVELHYRYDQIVTSDFLGNEASDNFVNPIETRITQDYNDKGFQANC